MATVAWSPIPIAFPSEVDDFLKRAPKSAAGPDGLQFAHLRAGGPDVCEWLANCFNLLVHEGCWVPCFRFSYVAPLPKVHDKPPEVEETRPLSLMTTSSKVLASLLCSFLQVGSLLGRTIEVAVITLEARAFAIAKGCPRVGMLLLDLRRAFRSLAHKFIWAIMAHHGWLMRAVKAMYAENRARFVLSTHVSEPYLKGRVVRQGCHSLDMSFVMLGI